MSKQDGGSAFPGTWHPDMGWSPHETPFGMSLRDWFAGQALTGVMEVCLHDAQIDGETRAEMFARKAYQIADAMIKERAREALEAEKKGR